MVDENKAKPAKVSMKKVKRANRRKTESSPDRVLLKINLTNDTNKQAEYLRTEKDSLNLKIDKLLTTSVTTGEKKSEGIQKI